GADGAPRPRLPADRSRVRAESDALKWAISVLRPFIEERMLLRAEDHAVLLTRLVRRAQNSISLWEQRLARQAQEGAAGAAGAEDGPPAAAAGGGPPPRAHRPHGAAGAGGRPRPQPNPPR